MISREQCIECLRESAPQGNELDPIRALIHGTQQHLFAWIDRAEKAERERDTALRDLAALREAAREYRAVERSFDIARNGGFVPSLSAMLVRQAESKLPRYRTALDALLVKP